MTVLIHRPPEIVACATNSQEDLIQVPLIPGLSPAVAQLIGIRLPELLAPLPKRFIGHDDATSEQELFHVPVAQAETVVEPHAMADNLSRKPMMFVGVGRWGG